MKIPKDNMTQHRLDNKNPYKHKHIFNKKETAQSIVYKCVCGLILKTHEKNKIKR